jgi:hypothetical protein
MAPSWLENLMALSSKFLRIILNDSWSASTKSLLIPYFRNEYFIEHQWFVIVNHLFHNKKQTQLLVKIGLFGLQQSPME